MRKRSALSGKKHHIAGGLAVLMAVLAVACGSAAPDDPPAAPTLAPAAPVAAPADPTAAPELQEMQPRPTDTPAASVPSVPELGRQRAEATSVPAPTSTTRELRPLRPVATAPPPTQEVIVNGVRLDGDTLWAMRQQYNIEIPDGYYWYDSISGAWGHAGGPTAGFIFPGLRLGGPLSPNASGGRTGVSVNGRVLHPQEVAYFDGLFGYPIARTGYWLDSSGYYGCQGQRVPLGNLILQAQNSGGSYSRSTMGGYISGDGQSFGFFDPDTGSTVLLP